MACSWLYRSNAESRRITADILFAGHRDQLFPLQSPFLRPANDHRRNPVGQGRMQTSCSPAFAEPSTHHVDDHAPEEPLLLDHDISKPDAIQILFPILVRIPAVIMWVCMDVEQKRDGHQQHTMRAQRPMYFSQDRQGLRNMLKQLRANNGIETLSQEGETRRIGLHVGTS
ncbi:protein of unknown function [Nitrospira japonica]|uniref:Uncharacterized protein n=1 Tax=Nitrospira japonica TaxID=1325564 RepID=A0A1W1I0B7_9BACT|nr:protein of unknown function [Nitrospira japonica]